jgi:hypothetical protein
MRKHKNEKHMKTRMLFLFPAIFLFSLISSCQQQVEQVICTMEFRTVSITVNGASLTEYYTLRESTGDTIRISRQNVPGNNAYPVLDDSYQRTLQDRVENFRFQGWINDSLRANESFVIGADKCHIYYVSGNQVVD